MSVRISIIFCLLFGVTVGQAPGVTFDQFVGTNGFIDDPIDLLSIFGHIREYHNWDFNMPDSYSGDGSDVKYEFSRWGGYWDFDDYYTNLAIAGVETIPCIMGNVGFRGEGDSDYKPLDFNGASTTDPNSYSKRASFMWQYAARYGAVEHLESDLLVASGQVIASGLDLLNYYEDWNEQDKWWKGVEGEFSPEEYAAMASANVDGHGGTMPGNVGIKNADPAAKMVMGGIAKLGTEYVNGMQVWFQANRPNGDWPIDVINMHHYCNEGDREGQGSGTWTHGEAPEDNGFKGKVQEVKNWIDENVPGTELWITEFGYDVSGASDQCVETFSGKSMDEVWSEWIVRTYLTLSSAGVSRASQFMIRDTQPNTGASTRFQASGFVTCKDCQPAFVKKKGYFDVQASCVALQGLTFVEEVVESLSIYVYKYVNSHRNVEAYALWSPTSDGSVFEGYELDVGSFALHAALHSLDGTGEGDVTTIEITSGKVTVEVVEELPKFVRVSVDPPPLPDDDDDDDDDEQGGGGGSQTNTRGIVAGILIPVFMIFFLIGIGAVASAVTIGVVVYKKKQNENKDVEI